MADAPLCSAPRGDALFVDLDGFEGPLDLLLELARNQKVDLARLSILRLADQYLSFLARARRLPLETAGDYLVMAAWLAYLKSRLLLPSAPDEDEPSGADLAERLAWRLRRLEAMREAAAGLMHRDRLGRDVFRRGAPEGVRDVRRPVWGDVTLSALLTAYARRKRTEPSPPLRLDRAGVFPVEEALARLASSLGDDGGWERLESFLPPGLCGGVSSRSALASTFVAALEMSRSGRARLRQERPFGPIFLRARRVDAS